MPRRKFEGLVFENNRPTEASLRAHHRDVKERSRAHLPVTRAASTARREAKISAREAARTAQIDKICSPRKTRSQRRLIYPRGQPTNEEAHLMAELGSRSLRHLFERGELIAPMDIPISPGMEEKWPLAAAKARKQAEARAAVERVRASRDRASKASTARAKPTTIRTKLSTTRTTKKAPPTYPSSLRHPAFPSGNRLYAGPAKIGKKPTISPSYKKSLHSKSVTFSPSVTDNVSQKAYRYLRQVSKLRDEIEDERIFGRVLDLLGEAENELAAIQMVGGSVDF